MAIQVTPDVGTLQREVQLKYTELAESPDLTFHFHHGRPLAKILGYPMDIVDAMPDQAVESFAGVGNPFSVGGMFVSGAVVALLIYETAPSRRKVAPRWQDQPAFISP